MNRYTSNQQSLLKIIFLVCKVLSTLQLELQIAPSTVITTKTNFIATAKVYDVVVSRYKFAFGGWKFETPQAKIVHRFSLPGKYSVRVSTFGNSTWSKWISKEILVFDHNTVMASECTVNVTFFGLVEKRTTIDRVPQGYILDARIAVAFNACLGRCSITLKETSVSGNKTTLGNFSRYIEMISYGNGEEKNLYLNVSKCASIEAHLEFVTPRKTIVLDKQLKTSNFSQCYNKSGVNQNQIAALKNMQPNTIVAIFYVVLIFLYVLDFFIAYRGHKQLLKPAQDLTNKEDDHIYDIRIHVGSGLSIKSTKCIIQFTLFGTNDVLGPLHLPVASFEDDGIASFLVSAPKEIGSAGTIGVFCKNMDLSSDWYLRKVDIYKHSEKPNGALWSDTDIITKLAKFECHAWFSPASNTHSVSQVFHKNTERLQQSLLLDYFSRCKQLFLQKHLVTSWTCSYGLQSFSKIQRLAFLYSLWLVLTCLATIYLQSRGWHEKYSTVHMLHIGVIRLNRLTTVFAFASAISTYIIAAFLSTVVRLIHFKPNNEHTGNSVFRPLHIDVVQSRQVYTREKNQKITFKGNDSEQSSNMQFTKDTTQNNNASNLEGSANNGGITSRDLLNLGKNEEIATVNTVLPSNRSEGTYNALYEKDRQAELSMTGTRNSPDSSQEQRAHNQNVDANDISLNVEDEHFGGDEYSQGSTESHKMYCPNGLNDISEHKEESNKDISNENVLAAPVDSGLTLNCSSNHIDDLYLKDEEVNSNGTNNNSSKPNDFINNNEVQFLNRETLPTKKENKLKVCFLQLINIGFWILHFLLLSFSVLYTLINSASWSSDVAYHWISMSTLGMAVCCCIIDTVRVLIYVLIITIKERRDLRKIERKTSFAKHSQYLITSRQAEFEKNRFFSNEFSSEKLMMVKNHYRLKGKVKDFLIFALFVSVLLILTNWTMSSESFRFWFSIENYLFSFKKLSTIQSKGSVDPVVNFWKWLRIVLPPILNSTQRDLSTQQLFVLGNSLSLIQKRITKGRCTVPADMKTLIDECNVAFDKKYEDRLSYSKGWSLLKDGQASKDPWQFQNSLTPNETLKSQASQPLEGYVAKFNATNINRSINELSKYNWIDRYTREVYLEVFVYEPSSNFLSPALIALEFTASGYISIKGSFFNFVLFPDFSPQHQYVQFAELIFFIMTFYFIFDIVKRKHRMSSSWFSGWLVTEALVIALSFVVIVLFALKSICVYNLTLGSLQSNLNSATLHRIASYQRILEQVMAALNLLSIALLTKPLFTLGLFDDMYLAVVQTLIDMKGIATETFVIIFAFMFWARAAFVAQISTFSTLGSTFPTLMDMLVSPDNGDLYKSSFFGPLLLLLYYCMMILLISNIFISAVQQSYSKARRAFEDMERGTVLKYFVKSFNKKGNKRLLKLTLSKKIGTFRRQTNLKSLERSDSIANAHNSVESLDGQNGQKVKERSEYNREIDRNISSTNGSVFKTNLENETALFQAVQRLETFSNKKIRAEDVEDRVLISAISNGWKKIVERKPTMNIIALYKQRLRKTTDQSM